MGAWSPAFACLVVASLALAGCIQPEDASQDDADATPAPTATPTEETPCEPGQTPPSTPSAGPSQGGVSNQPGAFSYGGQAAAKTGIENYAWENMMAAAQVSWGGQAATGMVRLTILDACGIEVYRGDQTGPAQGGGVEPTDAGTPGTWLLTFEFTAFTGQMGLSITSA